MRRGDCEQGAHRRRAEGEVERRHLGIAGGAAQAGPLLAGVAAGDQGIELLGSDTAGQAEALAPAPGAWVTASWCVEREPLSLGRGTAERSESA